MSASCSAKEARPLLSSFSRLLPDDAADRLPHASTPITDGYLAGHVSTRLGGFFSVFCPGAWQHRSLLRAKKTTSPTSRMNARLTWHMACKVESLSYEHMIDVD